MKKMSGRNTDRTGTVLKRHTGTSCSESRKHWRKSRKVKGIIELEQKWTMEGKGII